MLKSYLRNTKFGCHEYPNPPVNLWHFDEEPMKTYFNSLRSFAYDGLAASRILQGKSWGFSLLMYGRCRYRVLATPSAARVRSFSFLDLQKPYKQLHKI